MTKQIQLLNKDKKAYGGELLKTRAGRSQPRPIDTRNGMHVMLRSSQATGEKAFRKHSKRIDAITRKFAEKYEVRLLSMVAIGGHLHIQLKIRSPENFAPFIRATTSSISMAVGGSSRWNPSKVKFWDYRPYTRAGLFDLAECVRVSALDGERGRAHVIVAQS